MALVGITGGPATGKTTTLEELEGLGAAVADSDMIVHRLYREDAGLRQSIRQRWGEAAFDDAG
ncbi:MAG: dephospho-CoA kinase, partial [bacterium]